MHQSHQFFEMLYQVIIAIVNLSHFPIHTSTMYTVALNIKLYLLGEFHIRYSSVDINQAYSPK